MNKRHYRQNGAGALALPIAAGGGGADSIKGDGRAASIEGGGRAASIEGADALNIPFILKGFRAIYHFGAYFVKPFLSKKNFLRANILIMGERAILRRPPPPPLARGRA